MGNDAGNGNGDKAWLFITGRLVSHALVVGPFALVLWVFTAISGLQARIAELDIKQVSLQVTVLENRRTLDERKGRIRELEKAVSILHDRNTR